MTASLTFYTVKLNFLAFTGLNSGIFHTENAKKMQPIETKYRDIVLIGGGHAHAIVIKMWAMKPVPGVRLTLISNTLNTPYSGMLPGLISGHYTFDQTHIDLVKLCSWAKVRFIRATVSQLDTDAQSVVLLDRPAINYDLVSINSGSTPNIVTTLGAKEFATPVKPISQFYQHWQHIKLRIEAATTPLNIAVVGAGAGGFELITAIKYACDRLQENQKSPVIIHQCHWIIAGKSLLQSHSKQVQTKAIEYCEHKNIQLHFDFSVSQVTKDHLFSSKPASKPLSLKTDAVIWCTTASAAKWPATSGLAVDIQGFITVNNYLQSTSNSKVFAGGDIASQEDHPRPKAGVFAVRQGPVLFKNLCKAILEQPLSSYVPQKSFLSILATGEKHAIASKGSLCISGHWVWHWKDRIDQTFMRKLSVFDQQHSMPLQQINPVLQDTLENFLHRPPKRFLSLFSKKLARDADEMRCGGCGAKVASDVLTYTLRKVTADIKVLQRADVIIGIESPDDAAVIETGDLALAQSVDQFRTILDDPYLFAKIATNHALSDLHAMACEPQSALSLVAMPHASEAIQKRELYQLMYGVIEELNRAGCSLIGGHTSEAAELSLGLTVNGIIDTETIKKKSGIRVNQQLIITKPLGTGVIMAAHMQAQAKGETVYRCLDTMLQSNQRAATILKHYNCSAMTDVTGFGLIGHLSEMLAECDLNCQISLSDIATIGGASELSEQGIKSSLYDKNLRASECIVNRKQWQSASKYPLLFDPQTSGGLIAWVNSQDVSACLQALIAAGYADSKVIGQVIERSNTQQGVDVIVIELV